ncbi:uncharacterized protein BDV14DRAFT_195406 [Aspergillus stella-maris]|uniref:uncharacterized protein n=1 Tax=Aspergillus stella-maris TaxID=1810926 RepID=UPI003CCE2053
MPRLAYTHCTRAFKPSNPSNPCTSLHNMCTRSEKEFTRLRDKYPRYILSRFLPPGSYPVVFRGRFRLSDVGLDYAVRLAQNLGRTLEDTLQMPILVMGYSSFETHPHNEEEIDVSILIQFPRSNSEIIGQVFRAFQDIHDFQCVLPAYGKCPNTLFLAWRLDPMRGFVKPKEEIVVKEEAGTNESESEADDGVNLPMPEIPFLITSKGFVTTNIPDCRKPAPLVA